MTSCRRTPSLHSCCPRTSGSRTPQPQRYPSFHPALAYQSLNLVCPVCPAHHLAPGRRQRAAQSACRGWDLHILNQHHQTTTPAQRTACMHVCMHESTRCWGLLAARPHGTAITPLHSPEIVGQIFRDLSATACLSAPPNLEEKWIGSARLDPGPVQPQPGSCPLALATRDRPYPRLTFVEGGWTCSDET